MDKKLKHGFGDYVQVHTSLVDNTMTERTSGTLSSMPSGKLEGSWYYYLLINNQVVQRNRATCIFITDDIAYDSDIDRPDQPDFIDDVSTHKPALVLDNINIEDECTYDIETINDVPEDNHHNERILENTNDDLSEDSQLPKDSSQYADFIV